jgi:hypothetical protein
MLNERFRITLARIPWGEFITSKNPKLLRNFGYFVFMRLSTCMLNERFRITLARIPLGSSLQAKTQNCCAICGCFCFYALVNMHVDRCKNKKPGTCVLGFCL